MATAEIISRNPATGEEVGRVRKTAPVDLDAITGEAARVQRAWAARPVAERAHLVGRAADYILYNHREIAELITRENGKTLVEAYVMEVIPVIDAFRFIARRAPRLLASERVPTTQIALRHKRHLIERVPLGTVGVISPWNYPFTIPAGETGIALAAGNAVVLKPAPLTPLVGEWLAKALRAAGLPEGLLHVVHGDAAVGRALCEHPGIGGILFTGSVAVGQKVAKACGAHLKPYVLELGGKDAAIVLDDADLDRAARGILWGGMANCGQTCAGIERVYVARDAFEPFLERLTGLAKDLRPGDPLDPITQVGPLISEEQYRTVAGQVDDALAAGAALETGGPVDVGLAGSWYAPAVVTGVDHSMRLMREETFGPVVPVMAVEDPEEAIGLANDSEFGLGASVWSRDVRRARRIASRLDAGSVWINDHMYSHAACQLPWGGAKRSGVGATHGREGFLACTRPRVVGIDRGWLPVLWWHPYDETLERALPTIAHALYAPTLRGRLAALIEGRRDLRPLLGRLRPARR